MFDLIPVEVPRAGATSGRGAQTHSQQPGHRHRGGNPGARFASALSRTHGLAWIAPLIGVWTIITPWVVSGEVNTTTVVVNNVIVGAVLVLLGIAAFVAGMRRAPR